jgi:uncharacterized repeat protein (TIGR01451 family)
MNIKSINIKLSVLIFILMTVCSTSSHSQNFSVGGDVGIAICYGGGVQTWGQNVYGTLGDGTWTPRSLPGPALISDVIKVIGGGGHCLAIKSDSTLWSWGWNSTGQLGNGNFVNTNIPAPVPGMTHVIAVSAGNSHSVALKDDGTVWAWGFNDLGQLGNGTYDTSNVPVQVTGLSNIIQITSGSFHNVALKSDGTVWVWGRNVNGDLGIGNNTNQNIPVQITTLSNIIRVGRGDNHSMAIRSDSTLWLWGAGYRGQLGYGLSDSNVPIQSSLTGIVSAAGGTGHTLALAADGTIWVTGENTSGELGDSLNSNISTFKKIHSIDHVKELFAYWSNSYAQKTDGTLWAWGYNSNGSLGLGGGSTRYYPTQITHACYLSQQPVSHDHFVNGKLYWDSIPNCTPDSFESKAPGVSIKITPGNFYSSTDSAGNYKIGVDNAISYSVVPLISPSFAPFVGAPCPVSYSLNMNSSGAHDTTGFDFGFEYQPCYLLRTDISTSRKRRCFRNHMILSYWNEGILPAANAELHLKLDAYDVLVGSSLPFTIDPADSSYVFSIGTVNQFASGQIHLTDSVMCISGITGMIQCAKAWILPVSPCYIDSTTGPNWDHSNVTVDGRCVDDTVVFYIINTGSNMLSAQNFRLYADNELYQTATFQLQSGDTLIVHVFSDGATIRLEADQSSGHPGQSIPRATVERCGTNGFGGFSTGYADAAPQDDIAPNIEITCLDIRDSYDPNEKIASPSGGDSAHIILPQTAIDYTINFQNTGTDTAYKIVIIDSLSQSLDVSTIEFGAASHLYTFNLSGEGIPVIRFTFNNINLPDSNIDELNSHGWVKFKIWPFNNLPLGNRVENFADILFDYNQPVRTNTTHLTLGNYSTVNIQSPVKNKQANKCYPTIVSNLLFIDDPAGNPLLNAAFYSIDGRLMFMHDITSGHPAKIDVSGLKNGLYIVHCTNAHSSENFKIVKL